MRHQQQIQEVHQQREQRAGTISTIEQGTVWVCHVGVVLVRVICQTLKQIGFEINP